MAKAERLIYQHEAKILVFDKYRVRHCIDDRVQVMLIVDQLGLEVFALRHINHRSHQEMVSVLILEKCFLGNDRSFLAFDIS